MKRAPLAVFTLALVVATAWPLSAAIGAATASAVLPAAADVQPAGCPMPDATPSAEDLGLPPGHPPIGMDQLPPGHPPVGMDQLPPGHPPVSSGAPRLPPGHPPIPSGHPPVPASPGPLFGEPVLLNI